MRDGPVVARLLPKGGARLGGVSSPYCSLNLSDCPLSPR